MGLWEALTLIGLIDCLWRQHFTCIHVHICIDVYMYVMMYCIIISVCHRFAMCGRHHIMHLHTRVAPGMCTPMHYNIMYRYPALCKMAKYVV